MPFFNAHFCLFRSQQQSKEHDGPPGWKSDCVVSCCAGDWTCCSTSTEFYHFSLINTTSQMFGHHDTFIPCTYMRHRGHKNSNE